DRSTWSLPAVFSTIASLGNVPLPDLERTLNLGVGMVAVVDQNVADRAVALLNKAGMGAWIMGSVEKLDPSASSAGLDYVQGAKGVDGGGVLLTGSYAK
ncbi:MAG TPA: phosphoribosylformylglycinamidine cyclo-ligase, partial [Micrococcaceae bacterium]|nr:phosphoribosylformylglycinamidine cyclo-ligase [Micrococcaceae bacterium]